MGCMNGLKVWSTRGVSMFPEISTSTMAKEKRLLQVRAGLRSHHISVQWQLYPIGTMPEVWQNQASKMIQGRWRLGKKRVTTPLSNRARRHTTLFELGWHCFCNHSSGSDWLGKVLPVPWNWYQNIPKLTARSMEAQTVAFRKISTQEVQKGKMILQLHSCLLSPILSQNWRSVFHLQILTSFLR